MSTQILFGQSQGGSASGSLGMSLDNAVTWAAPGTIGNTVVTSQGVISNWRIILGTAPGAGKSRTYTLRINGTSSGYNVTISNTDTTGENTGSVTVFPGDFISVRSSLSGGPAGSSTRWSSLFTPNTANVSLMMGGVGNGFISASSNTVAHLAANGGPVLISTSEHLVEQVIATPGTIKNLYIHTPGLGFGTGNGVLFTVRKNGVDTALLVDIAVGSGSNGSNTADSVSVVAGDVISLSQSPHGLVFSLRQASWGATFISDNDDEHNLFGNAIDMDDTNTEYTGLGKGRIPNTDFQTSTDIFPTTGQACTLKDFRVLLQTDPGGSASFAFTVRNAGSDGNQTITVSSGSTTGTDAVNTDVIIDDALINIKVVPTGTPAITTPSMAWSCIVGTGAVVAPIVGIPDLATLCVFDYQPYFGGSTYDVCLDLKILSWKQEMDSASFMFPMVGYEGVIYTLNKPTIYISLRGVVYSHESHDNSAAIGAASGHFADDIDLEEAALFWNRHADIEGRTGTRVELTLPTKGVDRIYSGIIKKIQIGGLGGEGFKEFTLEFEVTWNGSKPEWRGWA